MEPLLSRIIAEPADLEARLVYGDALLDAGDPRGELIVAQCSLARAGVERVEDLAEIEADASELARLATLQRRVQQLEAQHGRLWLSLLELPAAVRVRFRRGMPEAITIGEMWRRRRSSSGSRS